nr:tripartite tricarboxylate transporter substrate binding protein [Bordetella genomosp. 9]
MLKSAIAALSLCAAAACLAQDNWPAKPITMIVPFPPGGVADTVARPVADAMSRYLKQSVVVENRAGAGGGVGMGAVARAEPDGYTVLMALSSISIIPEADRILGRSPMYRLDQFKPIARFTADPTVLVVRSDSPWQTARQFIDDLRRPDAQPVSYGSSGNYGTMHVPMEMLRSASGIHVLHVPYGGAGPAIVALLGGQVQAVSTGPASVLQYIQAGRVRPLATWGESRLAALPDTPTLKELGYDVTFAQWSGLFVPAATPAPVVQKLRAAAAAAAKDSKVRDTIQQAGSPILYMDAPEFQQYWDADAAKMTDAVRKIGKVE